MCIAPQSSLTHAIFMKSLNITVQHGHIYNAVTGQRLLLRDGVDYTLVVAKESDIEIATFPQLPAKREAQAIHEELLAHEHVTHIKQIGKSGDLFWFHIGAQDENKSHIALPHQKVKHAWFRIRLIEDLFLYSSSDWKGEDLIKGGKLADCACVVDHCEYMTLPFFEPIPAKSLTSVVKKTHIHYFGNMGSPSKNAFDCIYGQRDKSTRYLLENKRGFAEADRVNVKVNQTLPMK
jgi:hypothetical protein